jgi:electron transfer flavoprotein alpha subunit
MLSEIWVYLETEHERIKKGSLEILSHACKIADDSGHSIAAIIAGEGVEPLSDIAAKHGANKVYMVSTETPQQHDPDYQVSLLFSMIREYKPGMLFLAATPLGSDIAPRLAARLDAGLISNCVDLKLEKDAVIGRRSIMHGKAHATIACYTSAFCIATTCAGAFDVQESTRDSDVEIVRFSPSFFEKPGSQFLEYIKGDPATISLKEADTIIAIGRGIENAENVHMIEELAGLLSASIGGTRTAVDLKWLPLERQIGITGETVSPRLFISCGISGQYPHTVGMDASETIIVINKDRDAPIFKLASLGIIGPLEKIVPVLSRHIKSVLAVEEQRHR